MEMSLSVQKSCGISIYIYPFYNVQIWEFQKLWQFWQLSNICYCFYARSLHNIKFLGNATLPPSCWGLAWLLSSCWRMLRGVYMLPRKLYIYIVSVQMNKMCGVVACWWFNLYCSLCCAGYKCVGMYKSWGLYIFRKHGCAVSTNMWWPHYGLALT